MIAPTVERRALASDTACSVRSRRGWRLAAVSLIGLVAAASVAQAQSGAALRVHNNYAFAYHGPVTLPTTLPDGDYRGADGTGVIRAGEARLVVNLPAGGVATLERAEAQPENGGPLAVTPTDGALALQWNGADVGALDLGLVVQDGATATVVEAAAGFEGVRGTWTAGADGALRATQERGGYRADLVARPTGGGWLDIEATVTRLPGSPDRAYVALVRRVSMPGASGPTTMRWNGRQMEAADSPETWDRDFWYTRGLDWARWTTGTLTVAEVNGFTPGPPLETSLGRWQEGSHFRVWEKAVTRPDGRVFVSEIAGPNPDQAPSSYMPVTPYAAPAVGTPVEIRFRVALAERPPAEWAESQLHGFAGYRAMGEERGQARVDLGVPAVSFGVSYFPYSTFAENFGFYRTPGLDREAFWPTSPTMWAGWQSYRDRIRTDLRIIRSMGFERIRLHHLELLQQLPEPEALAYLDFMADECRALGLAWLADTEGPETWVATIAGRYRDLLQRVELENEILIPGIRPGAAERWEGLYRAAKAANPDADVFLTGVGNEGMFDEAERLGVPIDRIGLHAYKHGPQWTEAFSSHVLGSSGVASDRGLPISLSEFNWKSLTRLSPEARRAHAAEIYDAILSPRALPEVYLFQFQETISVNPTVARNGTRHYELVGLDRRPKLETADLMDRIRRYGRTDAPMNALPVEASETTFRRGAAMAAFRVTNRTDAPVTVRLAAECPGFTCAVASRAVVALAPGASASGTLRLDLSADALPGLYHAFVRAEYGTGTSWGWTRASNPGRPTFDPAPVLTDLVSYPQGADVVDRMTWDRPLAVAFGPDAPVLEMEMAYFLAGTLQAATGRPVYLSTATDLPAAARRGPLVVVGTPETNPLVGALPRDAGSRGVVTLDRSRPGAPRLVVAGRDARAVHAAAMDVVLRFWPHAKDASSRITGTEPNPSQPPVAVPENEEGATNR